MALFFDGRDARGLPSRRPPKVHGRRIHYAGPATAEVYRCGDLMLKDRSFFVHASGGEVACPECGQLVSVRVQLFLHTRSVE
jgi:hypothetical protein